MSSKYNIIISTSIIVHKFYYKIHSLNIIVSHLIFLISALTSAAEYYGKFLSSLKSYHHGLGGDVYAVDARTLHIRNFVYDGEGPGKHYDY